MADSDIAAIDRRLAGALAGETSDWPADPATSALANERLLYHGIAGLLAERLDSLAGWPAPLIATIRSQARAQAMWELRHRAELDRLNDALAAEGICCALLKGTAIAYDLYPHPAARSRGDSDLLVAPADVERSRAVLTRLGFVPSAPDDAPVDSSALQQGWRRIAEDGSKHEIDLHWAVMNAPSLASVLPAADCLGARRPLPRLGEHAFVIDRARMLIHCCVHRAMHLTAPYFVGANTYYGGDRLIWTYDIHLLARALTPDQWDAFGAAAIDTGVAAVCDDALRTTADQFGTSIPAGFLDRLAIDPRRERGSSYLLRSRQFGRAMRDLRAYGGARGVLRYLWSRLFPTAQFMRGKYPSRSNQPLPLLYVRRMIELVRARPTGGD